jgi:hypothetical protein
MVDTMVCLKGMNSVARMAVMTADYWGSMTVLRRAAETVAPMAADWELKMGAPMDDQLVGHWADHWAVLKVEMRADQRVVC